MKKQITLVLFSLFAFAHLNLNCQGLVAEGNNKIIGRNSALGLTPLYLGIGTSNPTSILHTNGSLRFEGLSNILNNRVLVTDANGNVSWRDANSIYDNTAWNINGNGNINDASNFLGTTNNQAILFKINNRQRFSISREIVPTGFASKNVTNVEVGMSNDGNNLANFYVWSRDVVGLSIPAFISSNISNGTGNMNFSASPGVNNTLGRLIRLNQGSTFANGGNDFYDIGIDNVQDLYFTGHQQPGTLTTFPVKTFTISGFNNFSRVGIKIPWGSQPTADFHTVGTVRHENLPTNTGTPLVIDGNGNVYVSSGPTNEELESEIRNLQDQINTLTDQIKKCCSIEFPKPEINIESKNNDIILYQNVPNPFSKGTKLKYYLPSTMNNALLKIYTTTGKEIKAFQISPNNKSIEIVPGTISSGTYIAIIFGNNGKVSNSIKMILTK